MRRRYLVMHRGKVVDRAWTLKGAIKKRNRVRTRSLLACLVANRLTTKNWQIDLADVRWSEPAIVDREKGGYVD